VSRDPNFDELVGGDDLSTAESERLRRVHDLLVAAGPPPDFEPAEAPAPPAATVTRLVPRGTPARRLALVAIAAAFLVAAFGVGFLAGNRSPGAESVVAMVGTPQAAAASASLHIFDVDSAGNWPMRLDVTGLVSSRTERPYELWLTKHGRLAALCGSFLARPDGTADVRMNAPYRLNEYDSWVVVAEGSKTPLLTTA
jgi:hypothetical protein